MRQLQNTGGTARKAPATSAKSRRICSRSLPPFRRGWGVGGAEICTGQGALTCTNPTSHGTSLNRATSSAYTSVAPEICTGTRVPVPPLPYRSGRPDLYGRDGNGTLSPVQMHTARETGTCTGTMVLVPSLPYRSGRPDLYGRGGTGTLSPVQVRTWHWPPLYRFGNPTRLPSTCTGQGALTCTNFGPAGVPPTPSKRRQGSSPGGPACRSAGTAHSPRERRPPR